MAPAFTGAFRPYMDNLNTSQKFNKNALKTSMVKAIRKVEGVNELKDIKVSYDKDQDISQYDIDLIIDYGMKIPDVAWNVQTAVIETVESITSKTPDEVNIHVEGVKLKEK